MNVHYNKEELTLKNDSNEEQIRTREIFEDLRSKAIEGETLLEREKDFLCTCLKLSEFDDGKPSDFEACSNYIFKELYLTYFSSALGASVFYKAFKGEIYEVQEKEKKRDFRYLQKECSAWLKVIEKNNHSDQILQQISSETSDELKKHKKSSGKLIFRRRIDAYNLKKDKLILHSKYIYLLVKQIVENNEKNDFQFQLLSRKIVIDQKSLIHIVNQHYAEIIKENPKKSYHSEDFEPDKIHIKIKSILKQIELSGHISIEDIEKIPFIFKNKTYIIWLNKKTKSTKGNDVCVYYRVGSFYPIEDLRVLSDLNENYESIKIDCNLQYLKKIRPESE